MPEKKMNNTKRYASNKKTLSQYANASQLRFDTWNKFKLTVKKLEEADINSATVATLQKNVEEIFEILEPIETYHAFPGKHILFELEDIFEHENYSQLSTIVKNIVRLLVTDDYRNTIPPLVPSTERFSKSASKLDAQKQRALNRHYFEVLIVDSLSDVEEIELRRGLLSHVDPDDQYVYDIVIVPSYEDALAAVLLNHNIQSCIIPFDFAMKSEFSLDMLQPYITEFNETEGIDENYRPGLLLGQTIRQLRPELDLFLIINTGVDEISSHVFTDFNRIFYRQENYLDLHLSIRRGITERFKTPFFTALKEYSQRPTGVFHAMPISRGNSVFKSHWIRDMGEFYGRNIFLAETSATSGGLDSLLQPVGPLRAAQQLAARAFGSQHTYFVTNGTSTANKIVMQALVQPGEIVLIDRDCHKSHHYGLVLAGAYPVYLDSYP